MPVTQAKFPLTIGGVDKDIVTRTGKGSALNTADHDNALTLLALNSNNLNERVAAILGGTMQAANAARLGGYSPSLAAGANLVPVAGNDGKLAVGFLPSHGHAVGDVAALQAALDGKQAAIVQKTAFNKDFGTGADTVCVGNDSRLLGKLDKRNILAAGARGSLIDRDVSQLVIDSFGQTGYVKIVIPSWMTKTMILLEIDVSDLGSGPGHSKFLISGYADAGSWSRAAATCIGAPPSSTVRFGYDGANYFITIGEMTTVWVYANVCIRSARAGFLDVSTATASAPTLSVSTAAFSGITTTIVASGEEVGSWTPTLGGDGTTGVNAYDAANTGGRYVCHGKVVYVQCRVKIAAVGTAANAMVGWLLLRGLPFALASAPVANAGHSMCTAAISGVSGIASGSVPVALFAQGASVAYLQVQSNSGLSLINVSQCAAGTDVYVSGSYMRA